MIRAGDVVIGLIHGDLSCVIWGMLSDGSMVVWGDEERFNASSRFFFNLWNLKVPVPKLAHFSPPHQCHLGGDGWEIQHIYHFLY